MSDLWPTHSSGTRSRLATLPSCSSCQSRRSASIAARVLCSRILNSQQRRKRDREKMCARKAQHNRFFIWGSSTTGRTDGNMVAHIPLCDVFRVFFVVLVCLLSYSVCAFSVCGFKICSRRWRLSTLWFASSTAEVIATEEAGAAGGGWKTKNTATLYFYYDPWRENMVARFSNKTTTAAKRDNS